MKMDKYFKKSNQKWKYKKIKSILKKRVFITQILKKLKISKSLKKYQKRKKNENKKNNPSNSNLAKQQKTIQKFKLHIKNYGNGTEKKQVKVNFKAS